MKAKFFFFIFKYKYRKRTFNNFLKLRKIKNYYIFDLSGIVKYYIFGLPLYFVANIFKRIFKDCVFLSCDAKPQLRLNGINLFFGGTSYKVPDKYKHYKNNCFVFENFSKPEKNLLNLYPFQPLNIKNFKKPKIVFIGSFNFQEDKIVEEIWINEKENIYENLSTIDTISFWKKYDLDKNKRLQYYYIQLKERLRLNLILKVNKIFSKDFVLVGSKWQKYIPEAKNDEYNLLKIKELYQGNICLDLGSKWGSNIIYPRSVEIIENGGLLVQSYQENSLNDTNHASEVTNKFNSVDQLEKILKKFLTDQEFFKEKYIKQYNFFNDNEKNYSTFSKIYEIAKEEK